MIGIRARVRDGVGSWRRLLFVSSAQCGWEVTKITQCVDDPLLLLPHEVTQKRADKHLDSGVKRTFLLALLHGVSESHSTVRWIFDRLCPERLFDAYPEAVVTFPADMKFQQYLLGLQQHSARRSYPYSLWSPFPAYSQPDVYRTADPLEDDAERFQLPKRKILTGTSFYTFCKNIR